MQGDAFQVVLVRCNWGRISNPRLQAQVNALDTFYLQLKCPFDKNVHKCKSVQRLQGYMLFTQLYIHISCHKVKSMQHICKHTHFQKCANKITNGCKKKPGITQNDESNRSSSIINAT